MSTVLTKSNLIHAICGATGSVISLSLFYPLDYLRTRQQVDDYSASRNAWKKFWDIIKEEGMGSLYSGWSAVMTSVCCSNFVYFYAYTFFKFSWSLDQYLPVRDILSAFLAGVVNVLSTTPLWVVNTRLKLQSSRVNLDADLPRRYRGCWDCFLQILRLEGVTALWSGTIPSLVLVANPAIHFMLYEFFKRSLRSFTGVEDLSGLFYFMSAGSAKFLATVITYPLQVIQSRNRAGGSTVANKEGLIDSIFSIIRFHGFIGLFTGLETKILQTVLTNAFMFLTYEKLVVLISWLFGGIEVARGS